MLGKWLNTFKGNTKISWIMSLGLMLVSAVVNYFYLSSDTLSGTQKALMEYMLLGEVNPESLV